VIGMVDVPNSLNQAIKDAGQRYHRLVLLIGASGAGKTDLLRSLAGSEGYAYLNVNLHLSQRMVELTKAQRARQADRLMEELIGSQATGVVILDNLEMLFDPALKLDPLKLLQGVSRNRTIVASWNGSYGEGTLTYAQPDHPEYRSYREIDAITVPLKTNEAAQT